MDIRLSLQGDAAAAIITPFVLLLLGWIVATVGRVRIARRQAEVSARVIDKLSPDDVLRLIGSADGAGLEHLLLGPDRPHTPILFATQGGIVITVLGVTLLAMSSPRTGVPLLVGLLVTAIGVGLLGAAAAGYWMALRWGLIGKAAGTSRP